MYKMTSSFTSKSINLISDSYTFIFFSSFHFNEKFARATSGLKEKNSLLDGPALYIFNLL